MDHLTKALYKMKTFPTDGDFPSASQLNTKANRHALRNPEDLTAFCDVLGIPIPQLPDWDLVVTPPTTWQRSKDVFRKATHHRNG